MHEIIERITKFNNDRDWDQFHSPENLAKSIAIEAGELLENFQWNSGYDKEKVVDELADILIYALTLSKKIGIDAKEIIMKKIDFNEERYNVKNSKGNSKKYTEFVDED